MKYRFIAMLLSVCLVLGMIPAVVRAEGAEDQGESVSVLTAYSKEEIVLDGEISDQGWQMHALGEQGSIGAQWQKKDLYLAIGGEVTALTVNAVAVPLDGSAEDVTVSKGGYTELSIPMAYLDLDPYDVEKRPQVGDTVNVSVTIGGMVFPLSLALSDIDWFAVENPLTAENELTYAGKPRSVALGSDPAPNTADYHGVAVINSGYEMYDKYNSAEDAANPAKIRTFLSYGGKDDKTGVYDPLREHDYPIFAEFDFKAVSLPDMGNGAVTNASGAVQKLYACYGWNIAISDDYADEANGNKWTNIIRAGICNIGGTLNFVAFLNNDTYKYIPLEGKTVGDQFRVGMLWNMDGSLTVTVDGVQVADIADVEISLHDYTARNIFLNLIRNENAPQSEADDMVVQVTNLAVGKVADPYILPTAVAEGSIASARGKNRITVDGNLSEDDWNLNNIICDEDGKKTGALGTLWDEENLYLAVKVDNTNTLENQTEKVELTLGEAVLTVDMVNKTVTGLTGIEAKVTDTAAEISIPFRVLDIPFAITGQTLPVFLRMGETNLGSTAFQGELMLVEKVGISNYVTFVEDATTQTADYSPKSLSSNKMLVASASNAEEGTANGAKVYTMQHAYADGFSDSGTSMPYAYLRIWNNETVFGALSDTSIGRYTEFTFQAEKLPVISSTIAKNNTFACYGFSWHIRGNGSYVSLGIINSETGLKLVIRKNDQTRTTIDINKKLGDTFRIGTQWYADGSIDVYIDGQKVTEAPVTGVQTSVSTTSGMHFNLSRPAGSLTSADQDMTVHISRIVMKKEVEEENTSVPVVSPTTVETAYISGAVSLDGKPSEAGWLMHTNVGGGKLGAQWDTEKLYLAIDTNGETISKLLINNQTVTLDTANSAADTVTEVQIPLEELGVTVSDYGTLIPISVTLGEETFAGQLKLIAAQWFAAEADRNLTDPKTSPTYAKARGSADTNTKDDGVVTAMQGTRVIDGGYMLYDLYDPAGENPAQIRSYVGYKGGTASDQHKAWEALNDSRSTWLSFDFRADSMPIYSASGALGWSKYYACYGFDLYMTDAYESATINKHNLVSLGIFNSADGLVLAVLRNTGTAVTVSLGKNVGDTFRVSVVWLRDDTVLGEQAGDLVVYIDGKELVRVEDAQIATSGVASQSAIFHLVRSEKAAESEADDMIVSVTNVAGGKLTALSLMDMLHWDTVRGENTDAGNVTVALKLPDSVTDGVLTSELTWQAEPAGVIAADGSITVPGSLGEAVTLTATMKGTDTAKTFEIIVPGTGEYDGMVTVEKNDRNPADGMGVGVVAHRFTLDENNNSIVLDLGEAKDINRVTLTDNDPFARLRQDNLTLWYYSDADSKFVRVEDFKLKHDGVNWYLYGFHVNTRYIKVHSTHYDGSEADFINELESMIAAAWDASLEASNAQTVSIPSTRLKDEAVELTGLTDTDYLRISLDGELLYHYVQDGKVFVRVPEPGTTGMLTVWNGASGDLELSNKEAVYEVIYGSREAWAVEDTHWLQTLKDGTIVGIYTDKTLGYDQKAVIFSYDGGLTWEGMQYIDAANEAGKDDTESAFIYNGGNFIYDTHTGKLIFHGSQRYNIVYELDANGDRVLDDNGNPKVKSYDLRVNFIASDDGGKTWYQLDTLDTERAYALSYTAGLELSTYDGTGPNVDFVFSVASRYSEDGTFCVVVAYSTDAGINWKTGESVITVAKTTGKSEGGASEATIMERSDGTLVLYTRNQAPDTEKFGKSYSYDHGITWVEEAVDSNVYTTNTQPMFYTYDDAPLLIWGGNNVQGGDSYIRTPMSVGVTYDGGENFRNLQDLYVGYSMQGLTFTSQHCIINPMVQKGGKDSLLICYWDQFNNRKVEKTMLLRVDEFTDYFYRTKGAYDSFEHGTVKYEGWDITAGSGTVSGEQKYDGSYSMKLVGATAARSIPYLQNGTITMQVYPTSSADLIISLQAAYSNVAGKCAPVNVIIAGDTLTLNEWNEITVMLNLVAEEPSAVLSVNGGEGTALTVDKSVGDYVCFITMFAGSTIYVDDVLVMEGQDAEVYQKPEPELRMRSITLDGTIGVNYWMILPSEVANDSGAYMQFTKPNGEVEKVYIKDSEVRPYEDGVTYHIFTCSVAAKEMTADIKAQFFYGDGKSLAEDIYCVKSYADYMVANSTNEKLVALVEAMLQYGGYAQTHFNYNTGKMANAGLDAYDLTDITADTLSSYAKPGFASTTGAKLYSTSLLLKSDTVLRYFFQVDDIADVAFACGDTPLTYEQRSGLYYADIPSIAAKDLDEDFTVTVTEGDETAEVTFSPLTYCYNVLKVGSDDPTMADLVKALYLYNQAANAYFG